MDWKEFLRIDWRGIFKALLTITVGFLALVGLLAIIFVIVTWNSVVYDDFVQEAPPSCQDVCLASGYSLEGEERGLGCSNNSQVIEFRGIACCCATRS